MNHNWNTVVKAMMCVSLGRWKGDGGKVKVRGFQGCKSAVNHLVIETGIVT